MSLVESLSVEGPHKEYRAMAFWKDDFAKSHELATKFAGESGRIATLLDVIDARIDGPELPYPQAYFIDQGAWSQYFNTFSGEYFGFSKAGHPLMVVAHGVGPLSTPEGVVKAYQSRLKPKKNGRVGTEGRIPQDQFLSLIDGKYGPVAVIDFIDYMQRYEYPLMEALTVSQALEDPLVQARLGVRFEEYIMKHAEKADRWADHENEERSAGRVEAYGMKITRRIGRDRFKILTMEDASNHWYRFMGKDQAPMAHLLSITQLTQRNGESLHSEVYCNTGLDSFRLVGIRGEGPIDEICPSARIDNETIIRYLPRFLVPTTGDVNLPKLVKVQNHGSLAFTEHTDETGKGTGEVEFLVTNRQEINGPVTFTTPVTGYYGVFRYNHADVVKLAPEDANAFYWAGEIEIKDNANKHEVPVQFCKVEVDTTQRVPKHAKLDEDFDTLMWIATQQ